MDWSREELLNAVANCRNKQFADLFLFAFALAAETHPEEMRAAVAAALDLTEIGDRAARNYRAAVAAAEAADRATAAARAATETAGRMTRELEALEERIDALAYAVERMERAVPWQRPGGTKKPQ